MFKYSKLSLERLETCHNLLQKLFMQVIQYQDITILYGYRSQLEQWELYKKGRVSTLVGWKIVDDNKRVTNCDGTNIKSNHNYNPSLAIDVVPYPIDWKDTHGFYQLSGIIFTLAKQMKLPIKWGGDFKGSWDLAHWELNLPNMMKTDYEI